jgi:hypothetical protein
MKTVRFSEVVESCGKPDTHLLLIEPAKDKILQAAIRSNRVMTVFQGSSTSKTDYGAVGFEEGSERQFLLFPKTLKPFAGRRVVGIKYDLLESAPAFGKAEATEDIPAAKEKKQQLKVEAGQDSKTSASKPPKPVRRTKTEERQATPHVAAREKEHPAKAPPEKLVQFPKPEPSEKGVALGNEVTEIKRRVREAMDMLEQGKQVAAFNLLKRIVEECR